MMVIVRLINQLSFLQKMITIQVIALAAAYVAYQIPDEWVFGKYTKSVQDLLVQFHSFRNLTIISIVEMCILLFVLIFGRLLRYYLYHV
jgi:putative flippase GtrA